MPSFLDIRPYITVKGELPYHIHETNESSDIRYYGYVAHNGSWIIMRQVASTGVARYFSGKKDFATGWTDKATHTYTYINLL